MYRGVHFNDLSFARKKLVERRCEQGRPPLSGWENLRKGYDHQVAQRQLIFLDTELDRSNPGALAVLKENRLDPVDVEKFRWERRRLRRNSIHR